MIGSTTTPVLSATLPQRLAQLRTALPDDFARQASAAARRVTPERILEGELVRDVERRRFTIDEMLASRADLGSASLRSASRLPVYSANDAIAAYSRNATAYPATQARVDTYA